MYIYLTFIYALYIYIDYSKYLHLPHLKLKIEKLINCNGNSQSQ